MDVSYIKRRLAVAVALPSKVILHILKTSLASIPEELMRPCTWILYRLDITSVVIHAEYVDALSWPALALVPWSVLDKERVLVALVPRLVTTFGLQKYQLHMFCATKHIDLPACPMD